MFLYVWVCSHVYFVFRCTCACMVLSKSVYFLWFISMIFFFTSKMENVAEKQEILYNLLTDLENAKSEEEVDSLRTEVQALKEKSDASLILLHVMTLSYL